MSITVKSEAVVERTAPVSDAFERNVGGFVLVAMQFALLYLIMLRFRIETEAFRDVVALCLGAFLVHHWLPLRFRMPMFLGLSLASIFLIFGTGPQGWSPVLALERGGWLLGIGVLLIGTCHLPIRFGARVALLIVAGAVLLAMRGDHLPGPVPPAIWPILGSMFMFRLIVYLYDVEHAGGPTRISHTLSYAFMVPNVCFPLFPVVDYKTFCRSHFNGPALSIYQVGLGWVFRGIVQLLIYRAVYYNYYLDATQVLDGREVAQFMLTNFFMYLRVSGQFHIIVGLLHLFGFRLPETHRRYYLATSFTDYWRRVNIYWKDFIMKIIYYPLMFRFKRVDSRVAMVGVTLFAFAATWALHSYQWYWLRGTPLFAPHDGLFWGILAVLVTINSVWEARRGRRRALGSRRVTARELAVKALKTAGTFLVICVLWSLWSSRSLADWLDVVSKADMSTVAIFAATLAVVMAFSLVPEDFWPLSDTNRSAHQPGGSGRQYVRTAAIYLAPALLLYAVGWPMVTRRLGDDTHLFLTRLANESRPVEWDVSNMERGYYEDLIDVTLAHSPLSEALTRRPADWKRLDETPVMHLSGDYRFRELVPSREIFINGVWYHTNRWGMRDRDYEPQKRPGTYRIAMQGASFSMGLNVAKEASFEALIEEWLNEATRQGVDAVEVLNFSVNGYSPICQLVEQERVLSRFHPDAVFFVAHDSDPYWTVNRLARAVRDGVPVPGEFPARVAAEAGLRRGTHQSAGERRLNPHGMELVAWAYRRFAEACREHGALPVWVYVPKTNEPPTGSARFTELSELAASAGFVLLDLRGAYGAESLEKIVVASWDQHPNAEGHRRLAHALYEAILRCPELGLLTSPAGGPSSSTTGTTHGLLLER